MNRRQRRRAGKTARQFSRQILETGRSAEALYHDGLTVLGRGDTATALTLIGQAVVLQPDNPVLHDNFGTLLQMLGRLEEAEAAHRTAIRLQPGFAEAHYNLGNVLNRQGCRDEAAVAFSAALAILPIYPEALNNLGSVAPSPDMAEKYYRDALAQRPDFPEALCNLGTILRSRGDIHEAQACYRRAVTLRDDYADAIAGLAEIAQHQGLPDDAETYCRLLLRIRPDSTIALSNLGNALRSQGRLEEAESCYRRALVVQPDDADCLNNLGAVLHRLGRQNEAESCFAQVLVLAPNHAEAHNNLANALQLQGKVEIAMEHYRRAIALKPDYAEAFSNLGSALQVRGDLDGAGESYRQALALRPDLPDAHSNLGTLYSLQARMAEAAACFQQALTGRPDYPEALNNLGNVLQWDDRVEEAVAAYDSAIALRPNFAGAHMNLGMALLSAGHFQRGWREYEWRWASEQFAHARRQFSQPQWCGEAAAGRTILVHAEQGFGDTLQFCRFAPLLAKHGLRVILEVQRPLVRLLGCLPGIEQVVAHGDDLPPFDLHCPLLSLPAALGISLDSIPAEAYLVAPFEQVEVWRDRVETAAGGMLKVGLVWAGSARTYSQDLAAVDRRRSIAWDRLKPLLDCTGVRFFCLQKDGVRPPASAGIVDFMGDMSDFADTAALVANLDLLISVDTAMVHLAGGLGRPVWVLNRFDSCWRWLRDRDDSPWYPSARLFRQPKAGDWDSVLKRVRSTLGRVVVTDENLIGGPAGGIPAVSALTPIEELFSSAITRHGQGRLEEAIQLYRQVITRRPDEFTSYLNMGLAQIGLGRLTEAVKTFRWVIILRPDCPEAHANLGCALDAMDLHGQALDAFTHALFLRPDYVEALNNRGKTLCALERFSEALTDFSRAIELDPASPQPRRNLAAAQREMAEHRSHRPNRAPRP